MHIEGVLGDPFAEQVVWPKARKQRCASFELVAAATKGAGASAWVAQGFEHADPRAKLARAQRSRESAETSADDHNIERLVLKRRHRGLRCRSRWNARDPHATTLIRHALTTW
jgi:hypothetical protein